LNYLPFRRTWVHPRFLVGFMLFFIFSFMCMFCRSLFVLLLFFFWPLCCLSFCYISFRDDINFPFEFLHLYAATFHQLLYMEYIYIVVNWCDISRACVLINENRLQSMNGNNRHSCTLIEINPIPPEHLKPTLVLPILLVHLFIIIIIFNIMTRIAKQKKKMLFIYCFAILDIIFKTHW
jgi:hypothetical protein